MGVQNINIAQTLGNIVWIIIRAAALLWLWNCFVPVINKNKKMTKEYIAVFSSLFFIELMQLYFKIDKILMLQLLWMGILLGYTIIQRKEAVIETVFVLLLYLNCRYLSFFVVSSFTNVLSQKVMSGIEEVSDLDSFLSVRINAMYIVNYVLYIILLMLTILPVVKIVQRSDKMNWYECGYLSVMNVAGIVLTRIMMDITLMSSDGGTFILLREKPELIWELPMVAALLYLGELSAVYIWKRYRIYRQHSELYFVENMEKEAIRRRLADTEKYYAQIRKVRHEMASHMTNIKGLAEQGNTEELGQYIADLDETIRSVEMKYSTGNPVTDVVINDRYRKAEEKKIVFTPSFAYDDSWGIPVYDLSIVLCNLLDNAIKAADSANGNHRYVSIKIIDRKSVILVQCENGYDKTQESQLHESDEWHGIGLKNVEDIAERFDGVVNINDLGNIFRITVMLKKSDLL